MLIPFMIVPGYRGIERVYFGYYGLSRSLIAENWPVHREDWSARPAYAIARGCAVFATEEEAYEYWHQERSSLNPCNGLDVDGSPRRWSWSDSVKGAP